MGDQAKCRNGYKYYFLQYLVRPLMIPNSSNGVVKKIKIKRDEIKRRLASPENISKHNLKALLQTKDVEGWKDSKRNGPVTVFTKMSEGPYILY